MQAEVQVSDQAPLVALTPEVIAFIRTSQVPVTDPRPKESELLANYYRRLADPTICNTTFMIYVERVRDLRILLAEK
jgi:hypothetical protein